MTTEGDAQLSDIDEPHNRRTGGETLRMLLWSCVFSANVTELQSL